MEALEALFQAVVVVFIVSTMLGVGLSSSITALLGVFKNGWFVLGALIASFVAVPLLGLGIAELLDLPDASYIALVLIAAAAGGPFSVALNKNQKGDVVSGAAMMTVLALVGSVTTPLIANWLLGLNDQLSVSIGALNVGDLVRAILILQVVPLLVGLTMNALTPGTASAWNPPTQKVASVSFLGVMVGVVLGGFSAMLDLIGSRTLVAGVIAALAFFAAGWLLSPGPERLRSTAGFVAGVRNAAPVLVIALGSLAAVGGLVPAIIAIYLVILVTYLLLAAVLGNRHAAAPEDLTVVDGISPAIEGVLYEAGITTLYELGTMRSEDIEVILTESDVQLNLADLTTWPRQASMAASGEEEKLAALQARLKGGREVDAAD